MGANGNKKDTEQFAKEVYNITHGEYTLTGEYILSNIETTIKHNVCGKEFSVKPVNFCRKNNFIRCPYCSNATNKKKTTEQFKKEVDNLDNQYIVLGEYIGNKSKILMKHLKCNREFNMKPNHFLNGERCPYCNHMSKGEYNLLQYIKAKYPQYNISKIRKEINGVRYELDIFIKELNIGFEYNGLYWHSSIHKPKSYHKDKQEFFKKFGIDLYYLWDFWGEEKCKNIVDHTITKDNTIESYPYIEEGTKYLYANKDLYLNNPPYIKGYKYIGQIQKKKNIRISNSHIFDIYNSGYWKYIKQ